MKIQRIDNIKNVYTIDTMMNGMERYNAAYIIDCGGKTVMVDCGMPAYWHYTFNNIKAAGFDPMKIDYLFITHEHVDHYGAAGYVVDLNPDLYVGASATTSQFLLDPDLETKERKTIYSSDRQRDGIGAAPTVPARNIHLFEEGQIIDVNGHRFRIYLTPGHRDGCSAIHYLNENILFCSDTVGNCFVDCGAHYSLCGNGINHFNVVYSCKRMKAIHADYLALGHYGLTDDVDTILDESIEIFQNLLDTGKKIMEETRDNTQHQKIVDFYWEQIMPTLEGMRVCEEPGRGQEIYDYATLEHIPVQAKRFATFCQDRYFPELAVK